MRTTSKPVIEALRSHILEYFEESVEYAREQLPGLRNYENRKAITPLTELKYQIAYMRHHDRTTYQTALDWVEGGSALVYYDDQRKFLQDILKQSDEESQRYSDDKVFRLYCHLIAREITKLVETK